MCLRREYEYVYIYTYVVHPISEKIYTYTHTHKICSTSYILSEKINLHIADVYMCVCVCLRMYVYMIRTCSFCYMTLSDPALFLNRIVREV